MGSVRTAKIRRLPDGEARELDPSQDPFARESIEHLVKRYGSPLFVIDTAFGHSTGGSPVHCPRWICITR
jgi:hypothetical protein